LDRETSLHHAGCLAWHKINIEQDKCIMNLSMAGLAMLLILAKDGGIDCYQLAIAYITGIVLFFISILSTWASVNISRITIESEVIKPTGVKIKSPTLLYGVQVASFIIGLACLAGIGVWSVLESLAFYI